MYDNLLGTYWSVANLVFAEASVIIFSTSLILNWVQGKCSAIDTYADLSSARIVYIGEARISYATVSLIIPLFSTQHNCLKQRNSPKPPILLSKA